ncbi:conserved hypothetical protein [Pseudomonas sp. 8BK]|uniref:hypothetical protein n=1 Tax=Pseudomonas sp. 8BK TaxID=2653164 RepID=UPI0012EF25E7|nr:hypothetical protein [Pseudomonas sp. 8BK]VXC05724.1 conserved hypothetical protein [Pseudomonas sp. 8BK]
MKKFIKYLLGALLVLLAIIFAIVTEHILSLDPDATYELRGRYKESSDGKTYLVIEDDNGGQCGPLLVDKKEWPYDLNQKGQVEPGEHSIECGTGMEIIIKEGKTYYFNYWGP